MVSRVVAFWMSECYTLAERIIGFSYIGVELTEKMLWAGLETNSRNAHMHYQGHAQQFVQQ